MKLALLSTHLTGTGHLVRMAALARAGCTRGHDVLLVNGGRPLSHLDLSDLRVAQLPPLLVGTDLDYATLRTPGGAPADAAYLAARIDCVTETLRAFAPDVLVTETWPLGRRNLAAEFRAALAASSAVRVASVRDIPEPKPRRLAAVEAELRAEFAALLVHGDANFIPLSETWPFQGLDSLIHHTGYVDSREHSPDAHQNSPPKTLPSSGEVLVASGGGIHGRQLLAVAAEAAQLSPHPWRILVGGPEAERPALSPAANLTVEPVRPDYPALLAAAEVSVSLCGYNTALDLAACETPAILVPMAERGEREQTLRARRLARFDGIAVIEPDALTAACLAAQVARITGSENGQRRAKIPLATDGAARAIAILESL